MKRSLGLLACALPFFLAAACGGSDDGGASGAGGSSSVPAKYAPPPASSVVESGAVKIRREVFTIPGFAAPPNPSDPKGATPDELQRVRVVRWRVDADPPVPARAVVVLMPGFLGGGPSFDSLARGIVRRSKDGDALEAWAVDRRSNLLEDHHGNDVAEVLKNAELAKRYYVDEEEVEGKTFAGFKRQADLPFASEWGLETTVNDLRAIVSLVPQADRRGRVVLVGHSLGASIVEEYAAWDFAGTPGYSELAGLVLVDGGTGVEGAKELPDQTKYEKGGGAAPGGFGTAPGVTGVRASARYFELPLLGTAVYTGAAVVAMRALWAPKDVVADPERDGFLSTLMGGKVPKMTNRAALGLGFDDATNGLSFAAISCGKTTGPLVEYDSLLGGKLQQPSDLSQTYDWIEFDATDPKDATSLDDFGKVWFDGPGLDFAEWYFPQRLLIDAPMAGSLVLGDADWPVAAYGLRAQHGASMDLPIFGVPAALQGNDPAVFANLKKLVEATPIGPGRPAAGTPRTDPKAFDARAFGKLTHIDPLAGHDAPGSAVRDWQDALVAFARANSPDGGVVVPPKVGD